jgi:Glycosyl hydrolases family 28
MKSLALAVLLLATAIRAQAEVMPYPQAKGIEASKDYHVRAGNLDIFVQGTPAFSMATFSFTGGAEVVVEVKRPIKTAVIRPLSLGITATVKENKLSFRITQPCHLAIEVDDDLRRPLFLFANAPELDAPKAGSAGVRYFEGGKIHEVGRIDLKDHETVYLAGGAVVRGVIRAENATGLRILGPGILDGSTREKQTQSVMLTGCHDVEINGPIVLGGYGWSIVPRLSENVRVSNVKVVSWRDNDDGFDPDSSRHVTVENCFFRTKDDCIAVKAHNRFGKDTAPSGSSPDSFNTEDVRVTKSTFWSSQWGHALTVGFAVSAPAIRNVVFEDCDIIKKEKGPAMSIDNHDLGLVENVRFENIRIEDGCDKLLALKVAFSEYSADCPPDYFRNNAAHKAPNGEAWERVLREKRSTKRGTIRNVLFKDVRVIGDRMPDSDIRGFSPMNEISDIVLQNLTFQGKALKSASQANLRILHATNVRFSD